MIHVLAWFALTAWAEVASDYVIPHPQVHFLETWEKGWEESWSTSKNEKYTGVWSVKAADADKESLPGEAGLYVTEPAKHYALSTKFPKPIAGVEGTPLVVQFELRVHKGLECGGGYIKLLADSDDFTTDTFSNETPYIVMFGPDKCGSTDKIHCIIRHRNPVTGKWEEKHLQDPNARLPIDGKTHLYTLAIHPDNTYELSVDRVVKATGSLFEDFSPPFVPPKEIDDPTDQKPSDWVDEEMIKDPSKSKPDDWDEDAPPTIPDPLSQKPVEWCDDCPFEVPDPEAVKPEDWDEEEDGEFEPPKAANPVCMRSGCGEWRRPQMENPAYKGKWVHPLIPNPDFKGHWKPRQIPNPDYFDAQTASPHKLAPIGGLGIELWTMQAGLEFDNMLVDTSPERAVEFAESTWRKKNEAEGANESQIVEWLKHNSGLVLVIVLVVMVGFAGMLWMCLSRENTSEDPWTDTEPSSRKVDPPDEDHNSEKEKEKKEEALEDKALRQRKVPRSLKSSD